MKGLLTWVGGVALLFGAVCLLGVVFGPSVWSSELKDSSPVNPFYGFGAGIILIITGGCALNRAIGLKGDG